MVTTNQYRKTKNCHTGEINSFGYALVPGSKEGLILLDLRTKELLDDLSNLKDKKNERRLQLLLEKGLIHTLDRTVHRPTLNKNYIKSMSTWLHIDNNCNLDCSYCYITGMDKESMSFQIADSYLDKLEQTVTEHGLTSVTIRFAGGEPTLRKKLIAHICDQMQKRPLLKNINTNFILITNGTVINSDLLSLIKSHSISVCISIDGLGKWHDKTRPFRGSGKNSFKKIFRNLNTYTENEIRPNILTTITEENVLGIPELSRFLIDNNLSFRYGLYRDNTGGYKAYENFMKQASDVLNDCHDYYIEAIKNCKTTSNYQLCDIRLSKKPSLRTCNIGHSGVTVDHIGNVFLCQSIMDKKPIGNIKDKDSLLRMAWRQDTLPELRTKDVLDYEDCKSCQWSLICAGGCSVVSSVTNGSATSASPYCKLFKTMIPKLIEIKALRLIQAHLNSRLLQKKGG